MTDLSAVDFAGHLGTPFHLERPGPPGLELTLREVTEADVPGMEQFSLTFAGHDSTPLGQGTYTLAHDDLGQLALFLVPIGIADDQRLYEAVFNRLRRPDQRS